MWLWDTLIYNPIFNALVWLYNVMPGNDIGVAIVVLTIIIKFILYPLTHKSLKSQKALQEIQPKVKEIQTKYKDNKEEQARQLMELYKAEKVSPMSSCLPILVQMPFIIAVYQVFVHGLASEGFERLYGFVTNPGTIDTVSFNVVNMAQASIVLAVLAALAQYVQAKMMSHTKPATVNNKEIEGSQDEKMLSAMNKQMMYFMPVMTLIIGATLPAGLTLYWLVSTLFMVAQQTVLLYSKREARAI